MEIEKTPPKMAKKLWNLVRIVFYMMRKGISKSKLLHDLDFLIKQGKTASKAIGNLMIQHHHHYSTLSCRSDDVLSSFVSPREYEFSCSNSLAYPPYHHSRRKNQHHHHYSALSCRSDDVLSSFVSPREYEFSCSNTPAYPPYHHSRRKNQHHHPKYDHRFHHQGEEVDVLQKVFDILNLRDHTGEPYPVMGLPGLGHSPLVRQLRVTDSPFAVNDQTEENHQVDKDAEKFIKRFYKDLRNQRRIAALMESPSSYHMSKNC